MKLKYTQFALAATLGAYPLVAVVHAFDDRTCGNGRQTDYRGDVSVTSTGRVCQSWSSQSPHSHGNTPQSKPNKGLDGGHNSCRNPDGEPRAWCYTTDSAKRWELCDVPDCADVQRSTLPPAPSPLPIASAEEIAEVYSAQTDGVCRNAENGLDIDKVYSDGLFSNDADGPGTCFNFCAPIANEPGYVGMQWRRVNTGGGARCLCFFDDGYVPTTLPAGSTTKTDLQSVGPVTGEGLANHYCLPFKGYMDAERRTVYADNAILSDWLDFDVYGSPIQIANAEKPYDQNQNHEEKVAPTFVDHASLSAVGNTWSSYLLPQAVDVNRDSVLQFSFALEEDTVEGFQAICLDEDTEETGTNGKCFVLRSSQGWISDMVNVPTQTDVGETTQHSIPIGDFFTGPVNYLVFIQDSDGPDQSIGRSSISDLHLISLESDKLEIEIDDTMTYIDNYQEGYSRVGEASDAQDEGDFWMSLSEDHTAVQINGNQWKALALEYNVTASTVLEFDVVVDQEVDFHAVCLDADLFASGDECVVVQSPIDHLDNFHHMTTKLETGVSKRMVIPFGSFMGLGQGEVVAVNYIAFIQDNDMATRTTGRSTWSNLRLYDSELHDIKVTISGESVTIPNIQHALSNNANDDQDSRDHVMSVSAPAAEVGSTLLASGNTWKYLTLPQPFVATPATVLKFTFELFEESELHGICLLDEVHVQDSRNDCFYTAGVQAHSSAMGQLLTPSTDVGQEHTYEVLAGSYFTGEVKYLGFILDNDLGFTAGDVERTYGQSSWSDIEIYDLPGLDVGVDGSAITVENAQISYHRNQDSTPIRDHMATISDDSSSINLVGNMWRALEFPSLLTPNYLGDFVVSFDFTLDQAGEIHAICFEENLIYGNYDNPADPDPRRCVSVAFFETVNDNLDVHLTDFQTRPGESHRYVLNLSKILNRLHYYEAGEVAPAPSPTPSLVRVGNNGSPAPAFPLKVCQGDCDRDSECDAGLKCFQRGAYEPVPGCEGAGSRGNDYCYDPYPTEIKYLAFINDNDNDNTVGDATYGNIAITTSVSSCLSNADFDFQLSDCTINNFLGKVQEAMGNEATCTGNDALMELFAMWDATQETDVYKQIEKICASAYKQDQFDFADDTLSTDEALERQLVKEYIDGGTIMNYEAQADSAEKIGRLNGSVASSHLLAMPKHHALDKCDVGAAMCCFVASRTTLPDNADVCYVDMKASRYTAHVRDGWSVYPDSLDNSVHCEGFAWGNGGSIESALKGNALFKVGFVENFSDGNVEQVPGAPLCGCMDRMPVVTDAACTDVTDPTSVVDVHFDSSAGLFDATFTVGSITYGDCGGLNLVEHYDTLVAQGKASPVDAAYMHERIVGDGGCGGAINDFLSGKGLVME